MPAVERIVMFRGKDGKHYWRHQAANNQKRSTSEGYSRPSVCRRAAKQVAGMFKLPLVDRTAKAQRKR